MAKTPETLSDLVSQDVRIIRRGVQNVAFSVSIDEFKLPKDIVFRDGASFLTPAEKDVIQRVIQGDLTEQIAHRRGTSLQTVKHQLANVGNRLRDEGYDIPSGCSRVNIIVTLLQMKELELRNPMS